MSQVLGPSSTPSALEGNRSMTDACRALPAINRVQAAKSCAGITVSAIGYDFRATLPSTRLSRENYVRLVLLYGVDIHTCCVLQGTYCSSR